jgi:carboxymethylenebutenolidase
MKARLLIVAVMAAALTAGSRPVIVSGVSTPIDLPTEASAKTLLNGAIHFSEFVEIPAGRGRISAFVVYPERADKAPVVLVGADGRAMSDRARAVAVQLARRGFIGVVSGAGADQDAVRAYAAHIPAGDGTIATVAFNAALNERAWRNALTTLTEQTRNRFDTSAGLHIDHGDHAAMAMAEMAQERGRGGRGGGDDAAGVGGLAEKRDPFPANYVMAKTTVAHSPRKSEWVDIPLANGKLHTRIVYPAGDDKAPIVLVLHGAGGANDWVLGVGDQLAHDGLISLTLDMVSGLGPNGGNFESFEFPDDVMKAQGRLGREGVMARIKAAREYGLELPRANGKSATLGFCGGGGNSFRSAVEIPDLNAAVVFYGPPPDAADLAKIKAPVIGFYGQNDARITATVEPTAAEMKKLGKSYEPHVYPATTHAFLQFQDLGDNGKTTADAWPRAIAFLRKNLM